MLVLTEADAARDEVDATAQTDVATRDQMLDRWACGFADEAEAGDHDRCADIIPELMIELI